MAGGLLNIVSYGNNNLFLTGNPSKTFFKVTYYKHTNFGLQKFRIDYDGSRDLRLTEPSIFTFKIPRYADLLMDTYLAVTLPDIWSPIYHPTPDPINGTNNCWAPYEFRWIENLGTIMISEVVITCGAVTLQKYTGEYLTAMIERDFTKTKKDLFNKMSGNVPELNDPANINERAGTYPSCYFTKNPAGAEPSIRGRILYIPINTWFTLNSGCAFPLIALQYNELQISVTLRPIQELFRVRDVFDNQNNRPYVQPDFTLPQFQMYRFLQTPPAVNIDSSNYQNKLSVWNADIHLISTYCFLSSDEAKQFALEDQVYVIKDVFQYKFYNITGSSRVKLDSNGMIASWMWYFQRNDANLRNEWTNYTNWPYKTTPTNLVYYLDYSTPNPLDPKILYNPGYNPLDRSLTGIGTTGDFNQVNQKDILLTMGILLNGEYRENILTSGIYNYLEKYVRTNGSAIEGLFCYNFCLQTSPFEIQPSGAINMSKFKNIELEITTFTPPLNNATNDYQIICDLCGNPIGVRKTNWRLYDYNYNMTVFEERYNVLSFISGNCGMLYTR
jgi:hypothetical protein